MSTIFININTFWFFLPILYNLSLINFPIGNTAINAIIKNLADVSNLSKLPIDGAVILILISMILTMIAGLIPAKMASKKDPVEALRTE